jgi:signal transduction histidine kinase
VGLLTRLGALVRAHQFDVSLVTLLLVLQLAGFGQSPGVGVLANVPAVVPIVALLWRRSAPLVVPLAYALATGLSLLLDLPDASSASTVVVIVAGVYSAGAYQPLSRAVVTLAVWWSTFLLDFLGGRETGGIEDFLFGGLILVCALAPGIAARRLRAQAEAGRTALDAAMEDKAHADTAVAAERARIARELHDVVAHAISIMVVQAAAADELLERDPARAHLALGAVQRAGRSAITEMARMLDLLRGTHGGSNLEPLPRLQELDRLVEEARLTGAEVVLDRHSVPPLPPAIELCAVRVVQEALTNAAKHNRRPHVRVEVGTHGGMLDIVVEDDGGSGSRVATGTGHGLLGLHERIEVFEGTINAGPRPDGGFRVHVGLPIGGAA